MSNTMEIDMQQIYFFNYFIKLTQAICVNKINTYFYMLVEMPKVISNIQLDVLKLVYMK